MSINRPTELHVGTAKCIYEPRGDYGLEGYQLNDIYTYYIMEDAKGTYIRVRVDSLDFPEYYETCSVRVFNKYFKPIKNV